MCITDSNVWAAKKWVKSSVYKKNRYVLNNIDGKFEKVPAEHVKNKINLFLNGMHPHFLLQMKNIEFKSWC